MEEYMGNVGFAFMMTVLAGLATGVGSLIAFLTKKTNKKFLAVSLGFSAGVMIYVSMVELFKNANNYLVTALGERKGAIVAVAAFFGGMLLISLIDKLIPDAQNPHEIETPLEEGENGEKEKKLKTKGNNLMRTGLFTAVTIAIHNFPEGLATFVSAMQDLSIALPVVAAIAIHNIPEGIAVSVPVYYASGSKKKAFMYSFLSGLAEPLGAIVGYLVLMPFMNDVVFGILFAAIAGIMVFISMDELLPAAREYGEHHLSMYGLVAGMIVMAVSLLIVM